MFATDQNGYEHSRSEVQNPTSKANSLEAVTDDAVVAEATARNINEFDLTAYAKDDFTPAMQKSLMQRVYNAFDLRHTNNITINEMHAMCEYLRRPLTNTKDALSKSLDEIPMEDGVSFETFWNWWETHHNETDEGKEAFAVVSANFSEPHHIQQLILETEGDIYTPNYRINYFFKNLESGSTIRISPWHDIPLYIKSVVRTKPQSEPLNSYNFITEIPKWTRAKFEIATHEEYNPIRQDMKNGIPRFYKHGDMMWNYGAFPQTWESTEVIFEDGVTGDNDPLDAIEIGMTQYKVGNVVPVKVLGVLGMIDDGQMDWKVIVIAKDDPTAHFMRDIDDVPKFLPGCLDSIREWLRVYKICQGGVENKFSFNGEYRNSEYAMKLIEESHRMWKNLRTVKCTTHFGKAEKDDDIPLQEVCPPNP